MLRSLLSIVRATIGWLALPFTAAVLATSSYHAMNFSGHDPSQWDAIWFPIVLGPLLGYGFLAGATLSLSEDPGRRGLGAIAARRSVWVAVGPWSGVLVCAGVAWGSNLVSPDRKPQWPSESLILTALVVCAYGWLPVALAAILRARRATRVWHTLRQGIAVAIGFVGSLLGTFWAATSLWRSYFFDATALRAILLAMTFVTLLNGCGPTTIGDLRRRQFFDALLIAWVIGLALIWRWLSRPRR
jgi:hypothetical protein